MLLLSCLVAFSCLPNNVLGKTMDKESFLKLYVPFKSPYHDSHRRRYFQTLSVIESYLKPNMNILDAGGGGDMMQTFLSWYEESIVVENLGGDFREDFKNLNREKYDLILSLEVVEHLSDRIEVSKFDNASTYFTGIHSFYINCFSLLKDDGIMITTTPNVDGWSGLTRLLLFESAYMWHLHTHEYGLKELQNIVVSAGFSIVSSTTANYYWSRGNIAAMNEVKNLLTTKYPNLAKDRGDCQVVVAKRLPNAKPDPILAEFYKEADSMKVTVYSKCISNSGDVCHRYSIDIQRNT
jgi:hypothetical protein